MKRLTVNIPNNIYDVVIKDGVLDEVDNLIREVYEGEKIIIITDKNVKELHLQKLENILKEKNFDVRTIITECGEENKTMEAMQRVYSKLIQNNITRKDLIVAFGGGILGDFVGFVASTILRGVPFVQIPTTLLSMVDSSVGGKAGVNLPEGKNLVGVFYQPKMVIMDIRLLKTLDKRQLANGMAELIKHAISKDKEFFDKLYEFGSLEKIFDILEEAIYLSCKIKAEIVEQDEKELGLRMTLNYGHTYGHAIEKYCKFEYNHGEAVAIGMVMEAELGEKLGITKPGTANRIKEILEMYNLPTNSSIDKKRLKNLLKVDKKMESDNIANIVLLDEVGSCKTHKISIDKLT